MNSWSGTFQGPLVAQVQSNQIEVDTGCCFFVIGRTRHRQTRSRDQIFKLKSPPLEQLSKPRATVASKNYCFVFFQEKVHTFRTMSLSIWSHRIRSHQTWVTRHDKQNWQQLNIPDRQKLLRLRTRPFVTHDPWRLFHFTFKTQWLKTSKLLQTIDMTDVRPLASAAGHVTCPSQL